MGGVVLSTQRMNRIVEVSLPDRLAVVEPGVVNHDLQTHLAQHNLFWPPDPSSARSCTIGGNIAMCAAGPNAVRFGVTRDWVLGLEAVLADGTVFKTGGRTSKGVVGYDLTRLIIGSEGTLAVVTRATLKLLTRPQARRLLRALFATVPAAVEAVVSLISSGDPPSAIEFLDPAALDLLRQANVVPIAAAGRAMLLLEVCGTKDDVNRIAEATENRLKTLQPLELARSENAGEANRLWQARYALSPLLKKLAPKRINEDVVVPVSKLALLIEGLADISRQSGIAIVNFGHAGNGNIHVNLLVHPENRLEMKKIIPVLDKVFRLVVKLDGSLSGEHGIGIQKQDYLPLELDPSAMALQKQIKKIFDPKGILNPGKVFPQLEKGLSLV